MLQDLYLRSLFLIVRPVFQATRCVGDVAEQFEGARETEQSVYDCGHCHRVRDLLSLHCSTRTHERVQVRI